MPRSMQRPSREPPCPGSKMSAGSSMPGRAELLGEARARMPVASKLPLHLAVLVDAGALEEEDVLHGDRRRPPCR